jgi:5-methylcytosine-specific restriction endonuclease McrA
MKEKIIKLREEGKSFREIQQILGCSKSTISYHCSKGQKEKTRKRSDKFRSSHPIHRKLENFKAKSCFKTKCERFQMRVPRSIPKENRNGSVVKSMKDITMTFKSNDVLSKFGETPRCYLSGRKIDWMDTDTYAFDHIIPASKGGNNSIDNLGICHPDANKGKSDLSVEEYIQICKEVLENNGYIVTPIL